MSLKTLIHIILHSLLWTSCVNSSQKEASEQSAALDKEKQTTNSKPDVQQVYTPLSKAQLDDMLDTVLYDGYYPPRGFIVENLTTAPIIAEGRILDVDSISPFDDKAVTFDVDWVWKGDMPLGIIKYATHADVEVDFYKNKGRFKALIFIKRYKKKKLYDYKDSIEYSPIGENVVWSLDRDFKNYMLRLQDTLQLSSRSKR